MGKNKKHIEFLKENITPEALVDFRRTSFNRYASTTNDVGKVELGVNGYGNYVVKHNNTIETFFCEVTAIEVFFKYLN